MAQIFCDYCKPPLLASKQCVQCNMFSCDTHLTLHNARNKNHDLIDANITAEEWKCSEHEKLLKYYCTNDSTSMCETCSESGKHKGHSWENLEDFANKKKKSLKDKILKLKDESQEKQKWITVQKKKVEADSYTVPTQLRDIAQQLETLHGKVNSEITRIDNVIRSVKEEANNLEGQKNRSEHFEDLCKKNNFTFLKNLKEDDVIHEDKCKPKISEETEFSGILHKELLQHADGLIESLVKNIFPKITRSKVTMDGETAYYKINVFKNLLTASQKGKPPKKRSGPERFRSSHVLSKNSFSSGSHYWEVDVKGTQCSIGVAYDSIDKMSVKKNDSRIGYNRQSWSLSLDDNPGVWHNNGKTEIKMDSPERSFRIFLEYEAGRLSFYQLCDPIRHLHTFTTIFTKPLHAAFYVGEKSKVTILH